MSSINDDDDSFMGRGYSDDEPNTYNDDEVFTKKSNENSNYQINKTTSAIKNDHINRPYEKPMNKVIYKVGNTSIALSQAKLYGIKLDSNDNIKSLSPQKNNQKLNTSNDNINNINTLSIPRGQFIREYDSDEERDLLQLRTRKAAAYRAMKNPRNGYDFVDRLNDRGDLVERLSNTNGGKSKRGGHGGEGLSKYERDQLEQDYEVKIDKLQCIKCLKQQSFDEYIEKKRFCSQCNERFSKLVVCKLSEFESRMGLHQEKRKLVLIILTFILTILMYLNFCTHI